MRFLSLLAAFSLYLTAIPALPLTSDESSGIGRDLPRDVQSVALHELTQSGHVADDASQSESVESRILKRTGGPLRPESVRYSRVLQSFDFRLKGDGTNEYRRYKRMVTMHLNPSDPVTYGIFGRLLQTMVEWLGPNVSVSSVMYGAFSDETAEALKEATIIAIDATNEFMTDQSRTLGDLRDLLDEFERRSQF